MKTSRQLLQAMQETLKQGEHLLRNLDEETYRRKVPVAFNASIGGHYRHCLDHFLSVFESLGGPVVDYDNRKRDARIECSRLFALNVTRDLLGRVKVLRPEVLEKSILVRCKVSYASAESPLVPTTVGREAMYAVTHAVHHYALMGVICGLQGVALPEGFGVAPSTLKHQAEQQEPPLASAA
jgi:hypothetical protein